MALPDYLEALLDPASYPHPCPRIELIETHISWVVLTGDYAYKLKKPVHFNFVDFSTLERRAHFCAEEVRCNRAFAPALYLGRVAVVQRAQGLGLVPADAEEPPQALVEWAVQMRQFDPGLALDRVLERGELAPSALDEFGRVLADRHAALPVYRGEPDEVPLRTFGPVEDNFEEIRGTALATHHAEAVTAALASARQCGEALRPLFDLRMTSGAVRECHGDLHLANLALIDGTVTAFDCLEFNENLRWIDTMSDVAFLFMDCRFRGETALAYRFLDGYLDRSGDYAGVRLLPYFAAYRSVVRAKVAALRWVQAPDTDGERRFAAHVDWARRWLTRAPGVLILTCGLSGSGKSYLASRLLPRLPAVRLRSDVARKKLAGLEVLESSGSGVDSGLYDPARSEETFDYLIETAGGLILSGENVIVDATFIDRGRRDRFVALARGLGSRAVILYCDAPSGLLASRVAERAEKGGDPSEADTEVLAWQQARFDEPAADEPVIRVDTSGDLGEAELAGLVRSIL
jgi:aminoglycoside phosphotransferase family enzyme/predicted kinase